MQRLYGYGRNPVFAVFGLAMADLLARSLHGRIVDVGPLT
jgi:hypothetical protein